MEVFRNRLYYGIKPLLPFSLRLAVRRQVALSQRKRVGHSWPIMPGSERPPAGWSGWPGGKRFAFVLTHDVEGLAGLEKCPALMKLEQRLGFRSAFNFIPEGEYRVDAGLRATLRIARFEVGVHDLYHDGKLYRTRNAFRRNAIRINQYLNEWDAVGFRSGFMLHNLDWAHDLEVLYDASTFDTDPFEPQPDNRNTIFPFWVPRPKSGNGRPNGNGDNKSDRARRFDSGYVELPYTLPQDSTLFLLLSEKSPQVWFDKLDWVARHGGMALVNVHPDYIAFDNRRTRTLYPAAHYEAFLRHVAERYPGQYWHVTPCELAQWYRERALREAAPVGETCGRVTVPGFAPSEPAVEGLTGPGLYAPPARATGAMAESVKPRRICMVSYSNFETDNRVMRYAEELARRGDEVEVFSLKRYEAQPGSEVLNGVQVSRIQCRADKNQRSRAAYLLPIVRFLIQAAACVSWRHLRNHYDLVHVHNIPDFLVFSAFLPKLTGAKVILDIHDIVPEFYASKFHLKSDSFGVRLLTGMENVSARFADHVIISNHLWRDKYAARTGKQQACSVFINNVDSGVFCPGPRKRTDDKLVVLFPGGLQWHQGLDIAIRAFSTVVAALPQAEFHIYGEGNVKSDLIRLAAELGLAEKVRFFAPVPVHQVVQIMADADLGVVPKRADSFGNEAYSTKIMEFMSLGIPVVVSRTKIDAFYFNDQVVRFFESGNPEALAAAIIDLLNDPQARQQLVARAREYALLHSWTSRRVAYLSIVDALVSGNPIDSSTAADPFDGKSPTGPSDIGAPSTIDERSTAASDLAGKVR